MKRYKQKTWKKIVSTLLAIVIAVSVPLAVDVSGSYLNEKFDFDSVLSAYAADIVDTKHAVALSTEVMKADSHPIPRNA